MIAIAAGVAVFLAAVIFYITRPASCPRCGEKHDVRAPGYTRPDRTTCGRCGTNYNPINGEKI